MSGGNRWRDPAGTGTLPARREPTRAPIPSPTLPASRPQDPPAEQAIPLESLHARRDRLAAEVAHLQWDLGGLTYEMAVRDHFRLDVLVRTSARMQQADAELAEIDRLLHLGDRGAAGTCGGCGALRSRAAAFCWSCGAELMPRTEVPA